MRGPNKRAQARFLSQKSLDVVNSSYSKKVLDSKNKRLLPTRSFVLNYRRQRAELISPNTVKSPSTDHCKAIIKAIFKVITKGQCVW